MKHAFLLLVFALTSIGDASMDDTKACVMERVIWARMKCGATEEDHDKWDCTETCASAMEGLPTILECCVETDAAKQQTCLQGLAFFGALCEQSYNYHCPETKYNFTASLKNLLPFRNDADDTRAVKAAEENNANIAMVDFTSTLAGAVEASVAMAVAWWTGRKQDVLLAN
eukprot:TRINITY_DN8189_c0_g1_i1.p1 TRINITY_DN8189_c0_g1~~TRINITY_DN8189_c0_g1_i1.p1  ORF type:complete len:171 (-),score=35.00 TRINITY_DN8189_c0_g1_i1:200-712(-)